MSDRGYARRRLWLATLAALVFVFGTLVATSASAAAATLPPEGVFENCRPDIQLPTCVQRLQVMQQAGFQIVVVGAGNVPPASLAAYASNAQSLGMSVMWELSDPNWWRDASSSTTMAGTYPEFASACGCDQNGPLLAYLVHWLGQLPGTYGYYAADDSMLSPGDQAGVASYVAAIKQADPVHTVMIGSADESQTGTYQSIPDVIGTEIYPVTTDSLMPVGTNQDMWASIAQWASDAQHSADSAGKQSAFILQAFTWGDNLSDGQAIGTCSSSDTQLSCYSKLRYPSPAEQLQLRNEILLHAHPKLILWWSFPATYGDVSGDTYSVYPTGGDASSRWSGLAAALQAPFPGSSAPAADAAAQTSHAVQARSALIHPHAKAHHRRHRRRHHRRHHLKKQHKKHA
jgi:hypothetical protein